MDVLGQLSGFYSLNSCEAVWSLGAAFDVPILEGFYRRAGVAVPWQYNRVWCARTIRALAEQLHNLPRLARDVAHTVVADAIAQVLDVQAAWRVLSAVRKRDDGPSLVM